MSKNSNGEMLSYNVKYDDKAFEADKDANDVLPSNCRLGKYLLAVDEFVANKKEVNPVQHTCMQKHVYKNVYFS